MTNRNINLISISGFGEIYNEFCKSIQYKNKKKKKK